MDCSALILPSGLLLPFAVKWAAAVEKSILREGVPLSEQELADARAIGVREPERVRLLRFRSVPVPHDFTLKSAVATLRLCTPATRGLALRYGLLVRSDCWRDRRLIAHELVHTAQYERLGGFQGFLRQYLRECLTMGYPAGPLEQEAMIAAGKLGDEPHARELVRTRASQTRSQNKSTA